MMKSNDKVVIEIDGERFEIQPDESNDHHSISDNHWNLTTQPDGVYLFRDGSSIHRITFSGYDSSSRMYRMEMNGQLKEVRLISELDLMIEKMGLNTIHSKKLSIMEAPMPGLVIAIKVAPGDHVVKGTPMLILEAMKMENVIAAPHDATIKAIKVNIGQAVERGLALVEFE
ncbi:MAG TPA: acetyl-CoA carboxylase biotin carboxyl carrier protein subunit [Saprospiraceae bacterium]|nr:acetyl-CoA carboxylase biotin carboxyl carrier protein subunit [Saprospiraceae bacterium]